MFANYFCMFFVLRWYGNGVGDTTEEHFTIFLCNPDVLLAVSSGIQTVNYANTPVLNYEC